MRLLIFTNQDKFFLTHLLDRAKYFRDKGWTVYVAAQLTEETNKVMIERQGFLFFDTQINRKSVNPFEIIRSLMTIRKIYLSVNPDFCFHLGAKSIFMGTFIARILNRKIKIVNAPIGLGHIFISDSFKARILRPIVKQCYKAFLNPSGSQVIIENQDDINYFIGSKALRPDCAHLIQGAGIDTTRFYPLKKNTRNDLCIVVMVSRLIKEKGVREFIEAAKILSRKRLKFRMMLVGAPDFNNPSSLTQQEYEQIKQSNFVDCLGYKKDILEVLQSADICCLPSYREGLPRALIEATACGLPIVTTNVIGCRDIVINNNGILVEPRNPTDLADAIEYLILHKEDRELMGKNSRDLAVRRFDKELINKKTYKVFELMLGGVKK